MRTDVGDIRQKPFKYCGGVVHSDAGQPQYLKGWLQVSKASGVTAIDTFGLGLNVIVVGENVGGAVRVFFNGL